MKEFPLKGAKMISGKLGTKFDLRARAWDISQSHHKNFFKFGGDLELTPAQERPRDQTFSMGILSRK